MSIENIPLREMPSLPTEPWSEVVVAVHRDQTYNQEMEGLFPHDVDPFTVKKVLDIGCGPAGWLLSIGAKYPHMQLTGIDTSQLMLEAADLYAQADGITQAKFLNMDATQPLAFPDESFDFIHARTILGFMRRDQWPAFVQECYRLLRPGGVLCLTEIEAAIPGSIAADTINLLLTQALYQVGLGFTPTGRSLGITAHLSQFLRQARYESVKHKAYGIDCSRYTEAWRGAFEEFVSLQKNVFPLLVAFEMTTQDELNHLYNQAISDMKEDTYGCMLYMLSAWGRRPLSKP